MKTTRLVLPSQFTPTATAVFLALMVSFSNVSRTADGPKQEPQSASAPNPLRNAYFGDLHVHTSWSLDAYGLGNRNDPRMAYRYGRGDSIILPGGVRSQLKVPLDFMAVTDHDIWLGELPLCQDPTDPAFNAQVCRDLRSADQDPRAGGRAMFSLLTPQLKNPSERSPEICGSSTADEQNKCFQRARSIWQQIQRNADEFYQPGKFTTLVGFEWTANFKRFGMLHRNVIFRGGRLPDSVFSAVDLNNTPERLWEWLEKDCTGDCQVVSIPHNTNFGWGRDLDTKNSDGTPFTTEGLQRRVKTEPLIELFQSKGNSECSPGLGTNDEQCNFEQLFKPCKPGDEAFCARASDYARNALKTGLLLEQEYGVNPFKYGFIGSTDNHSSAPGSTEEGSWPGAGGQNDNTPQNRLKGRTPVKDFPVEAVAFNPGGLAGVWAEQNTRESIFDALKRRESFATSGTRIRVRLFASWNYPSDLEKSRDLLEQAFKDGVPMGGDLPQKPAESQAPRLVVWATKDPNSANLQKIQIVKGWAEGGRTFEAVYDVVCSDGLEPSATHRCPDNGATVSLSDCSYSNDKGAAELSATWTDPEFKPGDRTFYYARVLENPTCRWSTHDALTAHIQPPANYPATIQERAWSSPIWYTPAAP